MPALTITARLDDLSAAQVQALIAERLAGMRSHTPAAQVHALALEALRRPALGRPSGSPDADSSGRHSRLP
jgi:hypothetical protein